MKKLFALLLAVIMVMSLATTAFAAEMEETQTGSITISNAIVGQKYTVYKMATLESYSGNNYSYSVNDYWKTFFQDQNVTVDSTNHLAYNGTTILSDSKFAAAAVVHATAPNATQENTPSWEITAESDRIVFENLPLGYYCVDSTMGTVCALTHTESDVTVLEKNIPPVIDKRVMEDSTGAYGKTNDDDLGETINFRILVTKNAGGTNYVVGDKLSEGLTFNEGSVTVAYGSTTASAGDFSVVKVTDLNDNELAEYVGENNVKAFRDYTFLVVLSNEKVESMVNGAEIRIDYTATLNENAVIGGEGNPNEANMVYGNDPKSIMNPVKTTTYSWPFQVFKYHDVNGQKTALEGAKFSLYEQNPEEAGDEGVQPMTFKFIETKDGVDVYQHVHHGEGEGLVTVITTNAEGKFRIEGLDSDVYYMKEVEAPAGYHMLRSMVEIRIGVLGAYSDTSLNYTVQNSVDGYIEVLNSTGAILPETGGMGTTLFYIFGGVMVAAALVLLVTKKRMAAEN